MTAREAMLRQALEELRDWQRRVEAKLDTLVENLPLLQASQHDDERRRARADERAGVRLGADRLRRRLLDTRIIGGQGR